jgi:carboxyl-terminal processing protease
VEESVKKSLAYGLISVLAIILFGIVFTGGFIAGRSAAQGQLHPLTDSPLGGSSLAPPTSEGAAPPELQSLFKPFWETWTLVHDNYVDQPVDDLALMRGAIKGMLAALGDEHTGYMEPEVWKQTNSQLQGSFEGIGAYVDTTADFLTIISPMAGSPAERAGLKAGDEIIAIDGLDMTGVDPNEVRNKVIGPAGSQVTLTIRREGTEPPFDVTLTREKIVTPSVEHKMLGDNLGYLKINDFGATTGDEVKAALDDLMAQNPQGLILDLRHNGGGYLTAAVDVGSEFLPEGKVLLYQAYGDGRRDPYETEAGGLAPDIPMVVLVDKATASASEVVAGALQDYGRAQLVGEQTYGKGSVQIWVPLSDDGGGVRITIAKWLTPKQRSIHKLGLTPDVVVPQTEADTQAGLDSQLNRAIELLTER